MNPHIHPIAKKDVPLFHQLFSTVLAEDFPGYKPEVVAFFLNNVYTPSNISFFMDTGATILGAWDEASLTGFAFIDKPYGGVSLCRWLGVKKEMRGKGIGGSLIGEWKKLATGAHCHKMELAGQTEARLFYEKTGFRQEGMRTASYFGIDQYIFGMVIGTPDILAMTARK